jgi:hypothetical protein
MLLSYLLGVDTTYCLLLDLLIYWVLTLLQPGLLYGYSKSLVSVYNSRYETEIYPLLLIVDCLWSTCIYKFTPLCTCVRYEIEIYVIALNLNLGGWTCELIIPFFRSSNGQSCRPSVFALFNGLNVCLCILCTTVCMKRRFCSLWMMEMSNEKRLNDHLQLCLWRSWQAGDGS